VLCEVTNNRVFRKFSGSRNDSWKHSQCYSQIFEHALPLSTPEKATYALTEVSKMVSCDASESFTNFDKTVSLHKGTSLKKVASFCEINLFQEPFESTCIRLSHS
jgi:hypothetical protein